MRRVALAFALSLVLVGCMTGTGLDAYTVIVDAASDHTDADSGIDVDSAIDAGNEQADEGTDADSDASETDVALEAAVDAALKCPAKMVQVPYETYCVDALEVKEADYTPWLTTGPVVWQGECTEGYDLKPMAVDDGRVNVALCAAATWCVSHGKRVCAEVEWMRACGRLDTMDHGPASGVEWTSEIVMGEPYRLRWDTCDAVTLPVADGARIRCCADMVGGGQ